VGLPVKFGTLFMSLSVAAFAMTSLDTATRLGRYALQELADVPRFRPAALLQNRFSATGVTVAVASLLIFPARPPRSGLFSAPPINWCIPSFFDDCYLADLYPAPRAFVADSGDFRLWHDLERLAWNVYDFRKQGKRRARRHCRLFIPAGICAGHFRRPHPDSPKKMHRWKSDDPAHNFLEHFFFFDDRKLPAHAGSER
jgi:hypothetical protein